MIGVILGPLAEQQLRWALAIGQGDYGVLVDSPRALVLFGIAGVFLLAPLVARSPAATVTSSAKPTRGSTSPRRAERWPTARRSSRGLVEPMDAEPRAPRRRGLCSGQPTIRAAAPPAGTVVACASCCATRWASVRPRLSAKPLL